MLPLTNQSSQRDSWSAKVSPTVLTKKQYVRPPGQPAGLDSHDLGPSPDPESPATKYYYYNLGIAVGAGRTPRPPSRSKGGELAEIGYDVNWDVVGIKQTRRRMDDEATQRAVNRVQSAPLS